MATESNLVHENCDVYFAEDVIVFDVETTGKDPRKDRIVQIALIKIQNNGQVCTWNNYFNPCISREKQMAAFKIHKISPDTLLSKKPFQLYTSDILDIIGDTKYLAGHNVWFDWNFLYEEFKRFEGLLERLMSKNLILLDTYKMSIAAFPKIKRYRLQDVAEHLDIGINKQVFIKYGLSSPKKDKKEMIQVETSEGPGFHDALSDTFVTKEVLTSCVEEILKNTENKEHMGLSSIEHLTEQHEEFATDTHSLVLIDKHISGEISKTRRHELKELANRSMSTLLYTRGKMLKDLSKSSLQSDIDFLCSSTDINNERGKILREAILATSPEADIFDEESDEIFFNASLDDGKKRKTNNQITSHFQQKKLRIITVDE